MNNPNTNNDTDVLTDEQLDQVVDTLKDSVNEDVQNLREIEEYAKESIEELSCTDEIVRIDPETGEMIFGDLGPYENMVDIGLPLSELGKSDIVAEQKLENSIKEDMKTNYQLSDADALQVLNVVRRYRKDEKFDYYAELPKPIQEIVFGMHANYPSKPKPTLNSVAKDVLNMFIDGADMDQLMIDMDTAIQKELEAIPEFMDYYKDDMIERMEVKLPELADKVEADHPEKAKLFRTVSEVYKDTYRYEKLLDYLANNRKARNRVAKDTKDYDTFCRNFNLRFDKCMLKLHDPSLMIKSLNRALPTDDISNDDMKNFVILFCKMCQDLSPDKIEDAVYMTYTISNILTLDYMSKESNLYKQIVENVTKVIEALRQAQSDYEDMMKDRNKKGKKKH